MKHEVAYYSEGLDWKYIPAEQLKDKTVYEKAEALAKQDNLTDMSGELSLEPRAGNSTHVDPHFWNPGKPAKRREYNLGADAKDARHNERIANLLALLDGETPRWTLGYYKNPFEKDFTFVRVADVFDYRWSKETTRILSDRGIVRHDLFGDHRNNAMSTRRPALAIEVINTHYPEPDAFDDMLRISSMSPYIIAFDFVDAEDKLFEVSQGTIRMAYYIQDGRLFRNGTATAIRTPQGLKSAVAWYLKAQQKRRQNSSDGK